MRSITIIAILEVVILVGILLFNPIFARIGQSPSTHYSSPPPQGSNTATPILTTNLTSVDAMLNYSQTAQNTMTTPPTGVSFLDEIEQLILTLTNAERHKMGLTALQHDSLLQKSARTHSADMLVREYFDHVSPEGRTPFDRIAIIHRQLIGGSGENIWQGQGYDVNDAKKLAELAMEGWMNSPGHRENILRESYTHLGVGGAVKGNTIKLTQNFASTQALFKQEIPLKVKQGNHLTLTTTPAVQKSAPVKYGFWLSEKGVLAADPLPINQTQVAVAQGDYRLRLYFVTSRKKNSVHYVIYHGPQIVVE